MNKTKSRTKQIVGLTAALVTVVAGGILFMGAISGWFSPKTDEVVTLEPEYYNNGELLMMDLDLYNQLVAEEKSFLVLSHMPTCTAELLSYVDQFSEETGVSFYYFEWSQLKTTNLHDSIRFAPSVAVVSKGKLAYYLRPDSDEDVKYYNNYSDFSAWIRGKIAL